MINAGSESEFFIKFNKGAYPSTFGGSLTFNGGLGLNRLSFNTVLLEIELNLCVLIQGVPRPKGTFERKMRLNDIDVRL